MSAAKCTGERMQGSGFRVQDGSRDQTLVGHIRGGRGSQSTQHSVLSTQYWGCFVRRLFFLALACVLFLPRGIAEERSEDFANRLAVLASMCDELGLKEQAETTRRWLVPRHRGRQYLFVPVAADPAAPKAGAPDGVKQWYDKFRTIRREHAVSLFAAAKSASDTQQPARAYQLLHEVLREDPDHSEARRVLGYAKVGNQWRLPEWEKVAARQAPINHPRLPWRARTYWNLETPHFQIVSNHSAREAREAGEQLENLHTLWRQVFFRYWSSPEALAARLAGSNEPLARERPKMQVVLFKTRQEYAAYVSAAHPRAAATLGLYDDKQRIAYFYAGDASVYPTWFHESTHQLFHQSVPGTRDQPGQERNFWTLEGAALYMESLAEHDGYWAAGGWESDRLQFARYRVLTGDLNVSLGQISTMSRDAIQNSGDIGRIYTQAAGLAHFLIDDASGEYREAFIELLTAIYRGDDAADSLARLTGQPLAKLDEEYRAFLNVRDDDLAGVPDASRLKNLSLCRTSVSDAGLAYLAGCNNLLWLDLSFTAASDEGLKHFQANSGLKQLFLEGTKVTAASLPVIAGFKQLEELDLSRLPLRDDDLAAISGLRNLKSLYLSRCAITDAGLTHLRGMKQLENLELGGTQVTADGLKRLRAVLPKLKISSPGPQP
jgi:hypothetical protein